MNKLTKIVIMLIATILITCSPVYAEDALTRGVNSYSHATIEQLRKVTKGTRFEGYEQVILDTEKANDVNAFFILAVAVEETSMGCAGTGLSRNNAYGLTSVSGGYAYYNDIGESIRAFGSNIKNVHFNNGRYTIAGIGKVYCPSNWSEWATQVENNINNLYYKMLG